MKPPVKKLPIPFITSAPVIASNALAAYLAPFIASLLTPDKLFAKSAIFCPICGNPDVASTENPFTIPPKNEPRASPIVVRSGIPLFMNSSSLGNLSVNAPSATTIPATAPIKAASAPIPINAAAPVVPTALNIAQHADKDINNVDNATAFPNAAFGSMSLSV